MNDSDTTVRNIAIQALGILCALGEEDVIIQAKEKHKYRSMEYYADQVLAKIRANKPPKITP